MKTSFFSLLVICALTAAKDSRYLRAAGQANSVIEKVPTVDVVAEVPAVEPTQSWSDILDHSGDDEDEDSSEWLASADESAAVEADVLLTKAETAIDQLMAVVASVDDLNAAEKAALAFAGTVADDIDTLFNNDDAVVALPEGSWTDKIKNGTKTISDWFHGKKDGDEGDVQVVVVEAAEEDVDDFEEAENADGDDAEDAEDAEDDDDDKSLLDKIFGSDDTEDDAAVASPEGSWTDKIKNGTKTISDWFHGKKDGEDDELLNLDDVNVDDVLDSLDVDEEAVVAADEGDDDVGLSDLDDLTLEDVVEDLNAEDADDDEAN
ncbi:hypothetical protein SPRG_13726 [Saprolegnia parasitica CBS 223.65]|uniref:RxLR effector protein n=1 Tax=Saprolegnia parasitica (strain CBS 223.65) TaxID=695850 RepID=A0A067C3W9_SAPPC|nr:hypothetical protein SPRG_13726 [Saprolegnia parasitica CBS 223.65]KDO21226.1 hypothetical protein SPRG_13726 [Saprolegnia parasitica CBS 223.65]|eukprot:XP_012208059.1 hypothetical protein SPRG_13726 [Saprolegnia parasitica CBS 223.65]